MCQNERVPKVVDRQNRRRSVAEAIHRIAAREGLAGASVRVVAAEAGLSVGAVQREFPTKDDLLRFALDTTIDEVAARFSRIRIGPEQLTFTEGLRAVLTDLLPTDERRRSQARIWAAFYARAAVDQEFARVLADLDTRTRVNLAAALAYAREQGELSPGPTPEALAELLMVLIDGFWLTCARLPQDASSDALYAAVDAAVALITTG